MGYDLKRYEQAQVVSSNTSFVSEYHRDRTRADQQIRRKLGSAYFYLRPEEKEEYIRSYFKKCS